MKFLKKINKISIIILAIAFTLGLVGVVAVHAVTPPDLTLGITSGYSVYGHAGITNTTGPTSPTRVWGSVGDNNVPGDDLTAVQVPSPGIIDHSTDNGTLIENDARSVYDSLMSDLERPSSQSLDLSGTHTVAGSNPITPGVYTVGASTLNGAVELSGAGVYIFRSDSSLTIATIGGSMTLKNGACASNVWWAVPASMTIGSGSIMVGNIIASTGLISLGTGATLEGRAISLTKAVTLDANQITEPTCVVDPSVDLSLTKTVNDAAPDVGDTIVFTITVTNSGPDTATGVIVGDLLPSGLSWVSDDSSDTYDRGSGVWTIGAIANDASKILIVSATVNGTDVGTITNTAEITASNEADADSTNDQDSVDVVVNTYTPPPTTATLHVIKTVTNDDEGDKDASDFHLSVKNSSNVDVSGSPADGAEYPGTSYTLDAGTYTVSEIEDSSYAQSISGDCNENGSITLEAGLDYTCTITNDDIHQEETPPADPEEEEETPPADPEEEVIPTPSESHSSSGGTVFGCKDPTATNYNYFSSSRPSLCTYASVVQVVTPTPVIPKLPKTGFPPRESNKWYEFLFSTWNIPYFIFQNYHNDNLIASASQIASAYQEKTDFNLSINKNPIRLKIPSINIDSTIEYVGIDKDGTMGVPQGPSNVAWYNLGPRPGEVGSAVIAGHSGLKNNLPAVFDNLDKVKEGDKIYIENKGGESISFLVKRIKTYDPEADASTIFTSKDGNTHLNLITCAGSWNPILKSHSERLVIFADKED